MALNPKCPNCGSGRVQLSNETSKHGCFWMLVFGIYYFMWIIIKWTIGLMILVYYDWWMAIIKACLGKGYVWQSGRWFSARKRVFYCHDCGYNFRG
ncbi:MAG: hypothetical protein IJC88_02715 [Oscillospiraceae bacterium]|nr:hypothetical protein [Oscillospiraceae bacterium]